MARATIKTIAQEAGVSIATVSKALNDMPDISDNVKARIREIALRQGYVTNAAARQLASGHSHMVGIVLPELAQHNYAALYKTLSARLYRAGYSNYCACSEGDLKAEAVLAADMVEKGVGALIAATATTDTKHIEEAVHGRVPIIYVGGAANPNAENAVACDDYSGGMLAGRTLHGGGCKRACVFTWGSAATPQHQRTRGFLAYMQENGVPVAVRQAVGELHEEGGAQLMRQALKQEEVPDGIFCTDDLLALGALDVLRQKGVAVPQSVQVMGYGDSPCAALALARLSTIALPYREIGICASDIALHLLDGTEDVVRKMTLEPQLAQRGTTVASEA